MSAYSCATASIAAAAGANYCSFRGTTRRIRIYELSAFCQAATASSIGIGHPGNTPAATNVVLGQAHDPADVAAVGGLNTTWSTAPTIPAVFMKRIVLPATIGAGVIWTWPADKPLVLGLAADANQWLTLWNFGAGAGSILSVSITFDE